MGTLLTHPLSRKYTELTTVSSMGATMGLHYPHWRQFPGSPVLTLSGDRKSVV